MIEHARPFVSRTEAEALADAQAQLFKARARIAELEQALDTLCAICNDAVKQLPNPGYGWTQGKLVDALIRARAALKEQK